MRNNLLNTLSKVTVVVPNFNHGAFLEQRIQSILNQTYQDFELILIDDCSMDNSKEILEHFRHHPRTAHLVLNTWNSGSPFIQWKNGIGLSKGEFIWIAESDDIAEHTFLEKSVPIFEKYPNIGVVTCPFDIIDESGKILSNTKNWLPFMNNDSSEPYFENGKKFLFNYMLSRNFIFNASGVIFRRNIVDGASNEFINFKQAGDVRFWVDILLNSDICFLKETLNSWRIHSNSVTGINKSNSIAIKEQYRILQYIIQSTKGRDFFNPTQINRAFEELIHRWWFEKKVNERAGFPYYDLLLLITALKVDPMVIIRLFKFFLSKSRSFFSRKFTSTSK